MNVSELAKEFFQILDEEIGPFDRPIEFRPFPFDAGGALNFLTVGRGGPFVTSVSWDLFGHEEQKRGKFGRYELVTTCDDEDWSINVLTEIGRYGLVELIEPSDTIDLGKWTAEDAVIQGAILLGGLSSTIGDEPVGLIRCIGVTRPELDFAVERGVDALVEQLKSAKTYPNTVTRRHDSYELTA